MPLSLGETTRVSEAIENSTNALIAVLSDLSQHTERLVSDATRRAGGDATAADLTVNAARLSLSWMKAMSKLSTTALDNLSLLTEDVARHFTSAIAVFPAPPEGDTSWYLRVEQATASGRELEPRHIRLVTPDGHSISAHHPGPNSLDRDWDGRYRVVPRAPGFVLGDLTLVIQPVLARNLDQPVGESVTVKVSITIDPELVET